MCYTNLRFTYLLKSDAVLTNTNLQYFWDTMYYSTDHCCPLVNTMITMTQWPNQPVSSRSQSWGNAGGRPACLVLGRTPSLQAHWISCHQQTLSQTVVSCSAGRCSWRHRRVGVARPRYPRPHSNETTPSVYECSRRFPSRQTAARVWWATQDMRRRTSRSRRVETAHTAAVSKPVLRRQRRLRHHSDQSHLVWSPPTDLYPETDHRRSQLLE